MSAHRPPGPRASTSLRTAAWLRRRSHGDRITKIAVYSDRDGSVATCFVPTHRQPVWTDAISVTLTGGA